MNPTKQSNRFPNGWLIQPPQFSFSVELGGAVTYTGTVIEERDLTDQHEANLLNSQKPRLGFRRFPGRGDHHGGVAMSWDTYFKGITQCPYIRSKRWLFVPPDVEAVVLSCTNITLTEDEMLATVANMQDSLNDFNWECLPLHPDSQFELNGVFDRRAPMHALSMIRHDVAGKRVEPLLKSCFYDNWPTGWERYFPGLEDK
jgi:hypothetical protein